MGPTRKNFLGGQWSDCVLQKLFFSAIDVTQKISKESSSIELQ